MYYKPLEWLLSSGFLFIFYLFLNVTIQIVNLRPSANSMNQRLNERNLSRSFFISLSCLFESCLRFTLYFWSYWWPLIDDLHSHWWKANRIKLKEIVVKNQYWLALGHLYIKKKKKRIIKVILLQIKIFISYTTQREKKKKWNKNNLDVRIPFYRQPRPAETKRYCDWS